MKSYVCDRQLCRTIVGLIVFVVLSAERAVAQGMLPLDLRYDPLTGRMSTDRTDVAITIVSKTGIFTGQSPLGAVYEFYRYGLAAPGGDFGPIAASGLTTEFLKSDLCIRSSRTNTGVVGPIRLNGEVVAVTGDNYCPFPPDTDTPIDPNTPLSASGERRVIIAYDSNTGAFRADVSNPQPRNPQFISALQIESRSGIFTGAPSTQVQSFFDVDSDHKLFILRHRGVQAVEFGNVAKPSLTNSEVANDLCVTGAWLGGGYTTAEYLYPGAGLVPLTCSKPELPADVNLTYDASSGDLIIDVSSLVEPVVPAGAIAAEKADLMTTLEVRSASGIFTGAKPLALRGPYDIFGSRSRFCGAKWQ